MGQSMNKITLIDKSTSLLIEEFPLDQEDLAHKKALELEKLDIEVELHYPSSVEQLGVALGASNAEIGKVRCEMNEEIDSH